MLNKKQIKRLEELRERGTSLSLSDYIERDFETVLATDLINAHNSATWYSDCEPENKHSKYKEVFHDCINRVLKDHCKYDWHCVTIINQLHEYGKSPTRYQNVRDTAYMLLQHYIKRLY